MKAVPMTAPHAVNANAETDPRVYFAAERTLLAWIRTGLAMMGFGFALAHFAPHVRELPTSGGSSPGQSPDGSLWFGTALVLMGVFVNLSAAVKHTRLVRQLRRGSWSQNERSRSGTAVAIALALVGVVVTIQLLWGRPT
jgi:putative membrane protein